MKKYTIQRAEKIYLPGELLPVRGDFDVEINGSEQMQVSDGYHTMDELYEHRITLFIALARVYNAVKTKLDPNLYPVTTTLLAPAWRSKKHDNGTMMPGWYILGIGKEKGEQITYHLPDSTWDQTDFAETLERAPLWDNHKSKDVLERLKLL